MRTCLIFGNATRMGETGKGSIVATRRKFVFRDSARGMNSTATFNNRYAVGAFGEFDRSILSGEYTFVVNSIAHILCNPPNPPRHLGGYEEEGGPPRCLGGYEVASGGGAFHVEV
jgi:hypothetical protein